jgi:hypothetical protein
MVRSVAEVAMAGRTSKIDVYLEIGKKKTFATAMEWPGWSRSGRDEPDALQTLWDYGPRYARALHGTGLGFQAPAGPAALAVAERLEGNATTDFGAPGLAPAADTRAVDDTELQRLREVLEACWRAFDAARAAAAGKALRMGPRGGGRDVDAMVRHVQGAEAGYLGKLSWKLKTDPGAGLDALLRETRQAVLAALTSAVQNGLPERGPRGGTYWTPRQFVRRVAWHALDHAWELEDRILE